VHEAEKLSLEAIGRFVAASEEIRFESADRSQVYGWIVRLRVGQEYVVQGKAARGLVRRYIEKMTGLSRAQVTRLIGRYTAKGRVQPTLYRRCCFPQRYSRTDIELLASVDEAHETLSGPATRRIGTLAKRWRELIACSSCSTLRRVPTALIPISRHSDWNLAAGPLENGRRNGSFPITEPANYSAPS